MEFQSFQNYILWVFLICLKQCERIQFNRIRAEKTFKMCFNFVCFFSHHTVYTNYSTDIDHFLSSVLSIWPDSFFSSGSSRQVPKAYRKKLCWVNTLYFVLLLWFCWDTREKKTCLSNIEFIWVILSIIDCDQSSVHVEWLTAQSHVPVLFKALKKRATETIDIKHKKNMNYFLIA